MIALSPRTLSGLLIASMVFIGCAGETESDAFGNFEADEVTVSAQAEGVLLSFEATEGVELHAGHVVGQIDSTQMAAQRDVLRAQVRQLNAQRVSLGAQKEASRLQTKEAEAQVDVFRAQLETATEEHDRTQRMFDSGAATERELNDLQGKVAQMTAQVRQAEARIGTVGAQETALGAQMNAVSAQIEALNAQQRQLEDRFLKTTVKTPVGGTVLTVMAREGELVRTGTPLFTMADLDPIVLRAYVSGDQLPDVRLGMNVDVLFDDGNGGLEARAGTVSFIAAQAEFTPSTIQTRDARADLVYAVEVRTSNSDGRLKRGMPGEVRFLRTGDSE